MSDRYRIQANDGSTTNFGAKGVALAYAKKTTCSENRQSRVIDQTTGKQIACFRFVTGIIGYVAKLQSGRVVKMKVQS